MREKNLWVLLTSADWKPFKGDFGFLPFILSTFYVSLIAIIIALPFSILTSIYLNSYASKNVKRFFEPVVDLLSGIPPVIYGVWGTLTIVPLIANKIAPRFVEFSTGYTVLAGGVVLAVMIIPFADQHYGGSIPFHSKRDDRCFIALNGSNQMADSKKVILRKSISGIIAATVLALSRAFGETMAVLMVCGNVTQIPHSIFDAGYPLPALIANNYGEMLSMPSYESALMLSAFLLFIIVVLFNGLSRFTLNQIEKRYQF